MVQSVGRKRVGSLSLQSWGFVAALAVFVFGFNLGGARSLTYHELYLASGAKQMATEGNWLYMKIGGQPWLEKPPLPRYAVGLPGAGDSAIGGIGSDQCISLPGAFAVGASPCFESTPPEGQ